MKKKLPRPKARNRESKSRGLSISQVRECRHMWAGGVCLKCGAKFSDVMADPEQKTDESWR